MIQDKPSSLALRSHHVDNSPRVRVTSPHGKIHATSPRPRQIEFASARLSAQIGVNPNRRRSRDYERRYSASPHRLGLGKSPTIATETRPASRCSSPAAKRHRRLPFSPPEPKYQVCEECAKICWDEVEKIAREEMPYAKKGRPAVSVGRRYRKLDPNNNCTLCQQLYAPWIKEFFDNKRRMERKIILDKGDWIHVFPNLQYNPHTSNFQTGRKVLRSHDAPYHIAIVPDATNWNNELSKHLAARGMVVVLDDRRPESRILQPRQIPTRFDPKPVRSLIDTCIRDHGTRCNSKPPEVKGMRVIDCRKEYPTIDDIQPCAMYVALSYVWGASPATGIKAPPPNPPPRPSAQNTNTKRVLELPKDLPRTIQDAIQVTKALGYQYLWVDKYCIDQHNPKEQQEQFDRMGDIYAGSKIAIFALGNDSEAGLPGVGSTPRLRQNQCRIGQYQFISTLPDPHELIENSQWSTRAWTYQEGLFSTKRLFFTDHQVYYHCNAMNDTECFKSDLKILHTNNRKRFRGYYRVGLFVCGNSTRYSHLDIRQSKGNHRKIDNLRRFQHQIATYTRRKLTKKDDILHASAAIARFYAKTPARIASLAGLAVPSPIANLPQTRKQEGLDHLTYALSWSHEIHNFDKSHPRKFSKIDGTQLPWSPNHNPKPQRRQGFPSFSWAGWFGALRNTSSPQGKKTLDHLPYCWTSLLSSVKIGFSDGQIKDYHYIHEGSDAYKTYMIRELSSADTLYFDAYVLDPREVVDRLITTQGSSWSRDLDSSGLNSNDGGTSESAITCGDVEVRLSSGPTSLKELRNEFSFSAQRQSELATSTSNLIHGQGAQKQREDSNSRSGSGWYYQCIILGTHGEPRKEIYNAIKAQDPKGAKALKRRIELFERTEPEDIVCLVVQTNSTTGVSYRRGLMRVRYYNGVGGMAALERFHIEEKKRFALK